MYDYQQEPDLDSLSTMDDYFDRVDDAWASSDLDRYQHLIYPNPTYSNHYLYCRHRASTAQNQQSTINNQQSKFLML